MRKSALWAEWTYILTFVSIPTLALYRPVKESGFIAGVASLWTIVTLQQAGREPMRSNWATLSPRPTTVCFSSDKV